MSTRLLFRAFTVYVKIETMYHFLSLVASLSAKDHTRQHSSISNISSSSSSNATDLSATTNSSMSVHDGEIDHRRVNGSRTSDKPMIDQTGSGNSNRKNSASKPNKVKDKTSHISKLKNDNNENKNTNINKINKDIDSNENKNTNINKINKGIDNIVTNNTYNDKVSTTITTSTNTDTRPTAAESLVVARQVPVSNQQPEQPQPKQTPTPMLRRQRRTEAKKTFLDPPQYSTSMVFLGNAPNLMTEAQVISKALSPRTTQKHSRVHQDLNLSRSAVSPASAKRNSAKSVETRENDGEKSQADILPHFSTENSPKEDGDKDRVRTAASGAESVVTITQDEGDVSQRPSTASLQVMAALGLDFCVSDVVIGHSSKDYQDGSNDEINGQILRERTRSTSLKGAEIIREKGSVGTNDNQRELNEDTPEIHSDSETSDDEEADERGEDTVTRTKDAPVMAGQVARVGSNPQLKNSRSLETKARVGLTADSLSITTASSASRQTSADPRGAHFTRDDTLCVSRVDAPSVSPFSELSEGQLAQKDDDADSVSCRGENTPWPLVEERVEEEDDVRAGEDVEGQHHHTLELRSATPTGSVQHPGSRSRAARSREGSSTTMPDPPNLNTAQTPQLQPDVCNNSAKDNSSAKIKDCGRGEIEECGIRKSSAQLDTMFITCKTENKADSTADNRSQKSGSHSARSHRRSVESKRSAVNLDERRGGKEGQRSRAASNSKSAHSVLEADIHNEFERDKISIPSEAEGVKSSPTKPESVRSKHEKYIEVEAVGEKNSSPTKPESVRSKQEKYIEVEAVGEKNSSPTKPESVRSKQEKYNEGQRDAGNVIVDRASTGRMSRIQVVDLDPSPDNRCDPTQANKALRGFEKSEFVDSAQREELSRGREKLHKITPRDMKARKGSRSQRTSSVDKPDGVGKQDSSTSSGDEGGDVSHADDDFDSFGSNDLRLFQQAENGEVAAAASNGDLEDIQAQQQQLQSPEQQTLLKPHYEPFQQQQEYQQNQQPSPQEALRPEAQESSQGAQDVSQDTEPLQQSKGDTSTSTTPTFPIGIDSKTHLRTKIDLAMASFPHRSRPISRSATDIRVRGDIMRSLDLDSVPAGDVRGRRPRPRTTQAMGTKLRGAQRVTSGIAKNRQVNYVGYNIGIKKKAKTGVCKMAV